MRWSSAVLLFLSTGLLSADETPARFRLPPGFTIERVASPPLIRYPLFACFDDQGRLYVAEGTGTNLPGPELLKLPKQLGRITRLEDTNKDGIYDKATLFADDLTFPTGVLWHDGAVYATSHPNLWRFTDTDGDGRADRREIVVGHFHFNGNGCDLHGPFLGPDGWLYWTDGRHGYKVRTREGENLEGFASRIWRCRTDGTGIERLCGGGFDNPVELAFTSAGDLLGTMDQGPGDALLHYVEGGVYPMDHPCIKEFVRTGPMLGSVRQYGAALPVALCGLCRYRSSHLGEDYRDGLFTAQFNVHRIEWHRLIRDGSTFRTEDRDFLTSSDYDTHFTDVLEDADGSLLIVDMGAWFNYGCPTSKIARPEVQGAIYRVRRTRAARVDDPWGQSLRLPSRSPAQLVALLDDPRPMVRDQVLTQLGKQGLKAIPYIEEVLKAGLRRSPEARRNALWALCRIATPEARAAIRLGLSDPEPSVRQVAAHGAGLDRDSAAAEPLEKLVRTDEQAVRLKAAEALGRIGRPGSIRALLDSQRQGGDAFLEHALIYALIRTNAPEATRAALTDPHSRVRRAGLIALDQMKAGALQRDEVVPLLDTDDQELQQAVLEVMERRPGWSSEITGLLKDWMARPTRTSVQEQALTGALLAFGGEARVQHLVVDALREPRTTDATRQLLVGVLARCRLDPLPQPWRDALGRVLTQASTSPAVRQEAVAAVRLRGLTDFDPTLEVIGKDVSLPASLRIAALESVIARRSRLSAESFSLLTSQISSKDDPLLNAAAARTLGAATLDAGQLTQLALQVGKGGPVVVPLLAPAFARSRDAAVGQALVQALRRSAGTDALAVDDLDNLLRGFPHEVQEAARPLYERLATRQREQATYLARLTQDLLQTQGNAERGRAVFFSAKAACFACHRAVGKGGLVGPDLSQVGRFRTTRDLLESIVFPSSSLVPAYRAYTFALRDGRAVTGTIVRETTDAVTLRTAQLAEVRLARKEIEEMTPSKTSLMPEGLEKTVTRQELSDLLEFLYSQR